MVAPPTILVYFQISSQSDRFASDLDLNPVTNSIGIPGFAAREDDAADAILQRFAQPQLKLR